MGFHPWQRRTLHDLFWRRLRAQEREGRGRIAVEPGCEPPPE